MNYKREHLQLNNGTAEIITIQTNSQNSFTKANMLELGSILGDIKKDDTVKGVIITSENPKFFCNGLDAETLLNTPPDELVEAVGGICVLFGDFLRFDKPVAIEVNGHAMGGGAVITVSSDYKYMLESGCRIGFTEVMVGLPLPGMFVQKIQDTVHPQYIHEVCMEGSTYKGKEAKEIGLINETATSNEELRKLSTKKLDTVFKFPLTAIRNTKSNINHRALMDFNKFLDDSRGWFNVPVIRENLLEAMKALQEKRRAVLK
ncbi:MAG: enoyl-CoA hydratase/isomerase family protein [Leptospiraceae bacterium]|nr:enoyl-CoA hydratase/isomerase family protein [Leptospiraceae bacterium]